MKTQFFGKPFYLTLGLLAAVFALAILVFQTSFVLPVLVVAMGVIAVTTVWRLEYGIAIMFAELFANSHGHLLSVPIGGMAFSSRMAVFVAVMAGWAVLVLFKKVRPNLDSRRSPFLLLGAAVVIGFLIGAVESGFGDAFKDGNAYLYALYLLPILSLEWTAIRQRLLLQVLAASAAWVLLLTLGTLYIFSHIPAWVLPGVYEFLRDTRTAEITLIGELSRGLYRVFIQAQLSVLAFALLVCPLLFRKQLTKKVWVFSVSVLALAASVVLVSLSRSFWVGLIAGGGLLVGLSIWQFRARGKQISVAIGSKVLAGVIGVVLVGSVALFPFPQQSGTLDDLGGLFASRSGGDVAISSRWQLLGPLMDEIEERPVFGQGFGKKVAFITDDPRIRAESPDGTYLTYALEWGWLDVWLKIGMLGIAAFIWILVAAIKGLWPLMKGEQAWLGIGLISTLVMLYATHIFSPYLNHPLGIGLILFTVPFWVVTTSKKKGSLVATKDHLLKQVVQQNAIPALQQRDAINVTVASKE